MYLLIDDDDGTITPLRSLEDFLADNAFDAATAADIRALGPGERISGGGGACPGWTVARSRPGQALVATAHLDGIRARRGVVRLVARPPGVRLDARQRETEVRVRAAITHGELVDGREYPRHLMAGGARGPAHDLAAAMAFAATMEPAVAACVDGVLFLAELGLDGTLRAAGSEIAHLCDPDFDWRGIDTVVVAPDGEAATLRRALPPYTSARVCVARDLAAVIEIVVGRHVNVIPRSATAPITPIRGYSGRYDLGAIKVPERCVEPLKAVVRERLHFLLIGTPGSGTTAVARRIGYALGELDDDTSNVCARIHSAARIGHGLPRFAPIRAPHHTLSVAAMSGSASGLVRRPGETAIAHGGLLFLDELAEFRRTVLEAVSLAILTGTSSGFPARFLLGAATPPCPCGYLGATTRSCRCSAEQVKRFRDRLPMELFQTVIDLDRRPGDRLVEISADDLAGQEVAAVGG